MYFFVIYQLSGIQKGIQAGHTGLEYVEQHGDTELYKKFIRYHKTWIILNGGTTSDRLDIEGVPSGTINQTALELVANDIDFSYFREPDLNDAITSLCFIIDERVFNIKDYPNFNVFVSGKYKNNDSVADVDIMSNFNNVDYLVEKYSQTYKEWVRLVGGIKNVYLRKLLDGKKLA
jgi:hypothetical protein